MAARDVRKNFNLFVDGKGYAGQAEEFTPPKLTLKTEEFRGGGMDGPIELTMGLEKLEASFSLIAYDREVLKHFDVREGAVLPLTLREALESFDGAVTPVVHSVALTYYKLQHGKDVVHEIDMENMVRVINGTDSMASTRAALGM